jgi:MFS superfamily sulfate permease-like transporter
MIFLFSIISFAIGIIIGLLIAIVMLGVTNRYKEEIGAVVDKVSSKVVSHLPQSEGYIIGLSEEEQSFKDSLKEKEKTGEPLE